MSAAIHIYREEDQPLTRFVDRHGPKPHWSHNNPRATFLCQNCRKRRWAKYLRIQVYYDCFRISCAEGRGCKKERRAA